ncbi:MULTISPECIES: TetR/AcrR family transcriptional regulator [unclassified Frondihabitans]|uniref:TetR/AcrR family transcriptional regulator n=1 Tax=unclassified Frondihabitans TaxID=2626248 RepID=UPI000F4E6EB2|nr:MULTISPECIES: TetR/AcrR family transcriptional regulator [unclassified Frondihabitans]RPE78415.1 TetR family transcriptional regulator [Frondihabitans sp. PhB153]RPF08696.1 TetR family transcriptional regulator [Frondihabitans sp. PhB161]
MALDGTGKRQLRTRAALVARARHLTARKGLTGFTIQELCDQVGVSRRTFFNYFPTKESAVLGVENGLDSALVDDFLAARAVHPEARRPLVDDLVEVAIGHFEAMSPTASDLADFVGSMQREPKLIAAMIDSGRSEQERFIARLAESQGDADLLPIRVAIVTFEALVRLSIDTYLHGADVVPFADILRERVRAARELFAPLPTKRLVPSP